MRKIAIIGTAPSGVKAPYDDEAWEIWGVGIRAEYANRVTRWFEVHRLDGEPLDWARNWREAVKKFIGDSPLYMIYPEPDFVPNVVQYPVDAMAARFGTYFMTSSFAWMMAMAIDELRPAGGEPVEGMIAIYGVDMEYGTEYVQQRTGLRHFIALADALGIGIMRLASAGISYEPIPYPMWQDDPLLNKLDVRVEESEANLKRFDFEISETRAEIAHKRAELETLIGIHDGLQNLDGKAMIDHVVHRIESVDKALAGLVEMSAQISKDIVHWQATREEQGWLKDFLQP